MKQQPATSVRSKNATNATKTDMTPLADGLIAQLAGGHKQKKARRKD